MNGLYLVAIGTVPAKALDWIESAADEWFPLPIRRLPPLTIPEAAYDTKRGQYQSVEIMKMLAQHAPLDASRVLGVTDVDLAIPMLSFLFGQAQFDGPIAVVSLCRLHQEFYGLPPQENLLRERTVKEVLHELGHTFGLVHCSDPTYDARIIAATNKNLAEEVQQGRFREDLYYRLNVIEIRLPPLRERREDVPLLAEHFVQHISSALGKDVTGISAEALKVLIAYDWPGNVRELENVIERAIVTCRNGMLDEQDFSWLQQSAGPQQNWEVPDVPLGELERRAIVAALERKHGNVKEASTSLGIDRSTLYDKLKRYEIVH